MLTALASKVICQPYPSWGQLKAGKYKVGFRTVQAYDSSRTYTIGEYERFRPMLIHLWYPATTGSSDALMTYKEYLILERQRENFGETNPAVLDNYCIQTAYGYIDFGKKFMPGLDITVEEVLSSNTAALLQAIPSTETFPLIVYAPSFGKSSIQNNIVCEYLASHGYIVTSVASSGETSSTMTSDDKGIRAQVLDMEFVIKYLTKNEALNFSTLGTFGFSWGGFSNVLHQMRNNDVKAIASWDGSIEYQGYEIAKTVRDFKPERMNVPYIFFSSKNTDMTDFPFYKSLSNKKKYLYRMNPLAHAEFASYWTIFANVKPNTTSYNLESYKLVCEYTRLFFDIYLKGKTSLEEKLKTSNSDLMTIVQPR